MDLEVGDFAFFVADAIVFPDDCIVAFAILGGVDDLEGDAVRAFLLE